MFRVGRRLLPWLGVALLLAACEDQGETAQAQQPGAAAPPPAVGVVTVALKPVSAGFSFIGRVQAVATVELRARVEGFLQDRSFTEGQEVKTGQSLFAIERDIFQAQVDQYAAEVASAQAQLANAEIQYQRALSLVKNQNVPQAEVDTRKANRDAAKAQVLLSEAQLKQAQINLSYTDITSPIDGKITLSNFDVGNLVSPSSGVLATIVSQDPMHLTFPVSARELLTIREERRLPQGDLVGIEFLVRFADGSMYTHQGRWDYTSPQVDQTTDTVTMRATIPNPDRLLIDGQYANVVLQERTPQERLTVPQAAIQVDVQGPHVLVVNQENKVEVRPVEIGQPDGTDVVVNGGVKAGDRVIVEGLQKVRPGQTVQANAVEPRRADPPAAAPGAPATPAPSSGSPG